MELVFHRLIEKDLRSVMSYYEQEVGPELSKRFYDEFERVVEAVVENPQRFHVVSGSLRRANFRRFPYHILFRETADGLRVLVLRHHRRAPGSGQGRR